MISLVTGLPGASKSAFLAKKTVELCDRNRKWFKKSGILRPVRSSLMMSEEFRKEYGEFWSFWNEPEVLPSYHDCDIVWDEMGGHVDSRSWEQLPLTLRRWFQQHRHYGVNIYGACQDFIDIDVAIRRLTGELIYLIKIVGSGDPSPTTPPVKWIWGLVFKFYLDPRTYKEETKFQGAALGGFFTLNRDLINLYNMFDKSMPVKYPPLQHRVRECLDCGYKKVIHV